MNPERAEHTPSEAYDHFGVTIGGVERTAVTVGAGSRRLLADGWRRHWRCAAIVADETVDRLHAGAVEAALAGCAEQVVRCTFAAGEASKSRETKARIEDQLTAAGVDRGGCIVALGGGVTLDLAGFVAATYLRGIDALYLPTSLLAQVDAAVGGKTGVSTPAGKNLIGAFHHPRAVLVDPDYLTTLPAGEWSHGLAEIVKCGVVADESLLGSVEAHASSLRAGPPIDSRPIARCLRLKARIVEADERDQGVRAILNFGHTIGHAVEAASRWRWGHGHAVAVGMLVEARLAERLVGLDRTAVERLDALCAALGLPERVDGLAFDDLVPHLWSDKKRARGLRVALPEAVGRMASAAGRWVVEATIAELRDAWNDRMSRRGP